MFGDKPLIIVETYEALIEVCEQFKAQKVIAVDLEGDSLHHYREKVALIQVSTLEKDYILDPIPLDNIDPFLEIMQSPTIVKVMHGSDFDVVSMKRDYKIRIENLFDTLIAASFLGFERLGLANLISHYFGIVLDKEFQRHDWSQRPLLPQHIYYARGDTHFLLALYDILVLSLKEIGWEDAVKEECHLLTFKEWNGRLYDGSDFRRTKNAYILKAKQLKILRALWEWRDAIAERNDSPPFKVLSETIMLSLSSKGPENKEQLADIIRSGSKLYRHRGQELLELVQKGQHDQRPLPEIHTEKGAGPPTNFSFDSLQGALKEWRERHIKSGIFPSHLLNNAQLKSIARNEPQDASAFDALESVRGWQKKRYSEELVQVIVDNIRIPKKRKKRS